MKKVIFSSIAALFAAICPAATTYNLANGNVTVPVNTEAIITQSNSGTHKNNSIWVGANSTITLAGINGGQITCNGNVTIVLADNSNNIVTAFSQDTPGINVIRNSTLTIVGDNGTLTVKGLGSGAGIGNTGSGSCGNIVINGGVISASGKVGIGGSSCGNITINGGKITASGSQTGIGSYAYSNGSYSCGNIAITGGEVKATGNSGAGIGSDRNGGACGTIRITGGTVIAKGGSGSSGIGVGASGNDYSRCGAITIANTVTKVVATKGSGATDCVGKADTHSTCGTVTFGNKLKKTYSNNNLTLTLQPVYTITWKDDNGTTLETDTEVILGTTPTYNGATPTKASTAQYSYTFKGWSPTVAAATADKTYTATYNATVRSYKVTWKDDDGTTLRVDSVQYGTSPGYGEEPTRDGYTFDGWFTAAEGGDLLSEGTIVTKDMSFFAHWKRNSFLAGEDVACAGVNVTLASAQAEWLNGLGDYETVKTAVAAMEADKFEEAYLLNLDLTNAERGYTFEVVGIDARGTEVVVTARLVRSGAVQSSGGKNAPINGVLRLYGSKTPEKNGFAPMADAVVSDTTFAFGETATLTLSKSGENRFFHAVIAAP